MRKLSGVALLSLMLLAGCARTQFTVVEEEYKFLSDAANAHAAAGEWGQVYVLTLVLQDARKDDPAVAALQAKAVQADARLEELQSRGMLGMNHPLRISKEHPSIIGRILLWPVNLLVDLADIITVEVGTGFGLGLNIHATHAIAVGAKAEFGETMIGFRGRHLSARAGVDQNIELLPFEMRAGVHAGGGTYGAVALHYANTGLRYPSDMIYQRAVDYWSVGASALLVIFGLNIEIHPVQLVDALCGIVFLDPMHDNFGTTEPIRFNDREVDAARKLISFRK